MDFISKVREWMPPSFEGVQPFELWLLVGAVALMTRGLRLPPVRLVLLIGLVHMALHHRRHQDLLGFLGPAIVAEALGAQWFAARRAGQNAAAVLDRLFASFAPPATKVACAIVVAVLAAAGAA